MQQMRSGFDLLWGGSRMWTDVGVRGHGGPSFTREARLRLQQLKGVPGPPTPNPPGSDGAQREGSALDLLEVLDVEEEEEDEESWLYELPRGGGSHEEEEEEEEEEERTTALSWSRHVLDNPSPDMLAARQALTHRLDRGTTKLFYRIPSVCDSGEDTPPPRSTGRVVSNTLTSCDIIAQRLQRFRDVHALAQTQEAALRLESLSLPSSPSPRRHTPSALATPPSHSDHSPSGGPPPAPSGPRLAPLQQQVTQFKLLKLAESGAVRTRSPLRTSLRSLQAVRNSRSLDTDDHHWPPFDPKAPGVSSDWTSSPPSVRTAVLKKLQRTQSLGPRGTPQRDQTLGPRGTPQRDQSLGPRGTPQRDQSLGPRGTPQRDRGKFSVHGRVHASPDAPTIKAWPTNRTTSTRR